jgi:formylmethanofuran:tetrahydromethanopterin formyltransferase
VNTPTASKKQAKRRFFHDFENNAGIPFFFIKKAAVSNSIIPAKVMLMAEIIIGGICRKVVVKNSIRIDSMDMVIA